MASLRSFSLSLRTVLVTCAFLTCSMPAEAPAPGVVVASVSPPGAGAQAGLRPGDVLLGWRRRAAPPANPQPAEGVFRSCAGFAGVELEQAPRGPVEFQVLRGQQVSILEMPAGEWQVEVLSRNGHDEEECQSYAQARSLTRKRGWSEAGAVWTEAVRRARRHGREAFTAWLLREQGVCLTAQEDFPAAERALRESLRRVRKSAPGSLAEAASWHALGRLEQRRGAFAASVANLRKALALRSRLAPGSLERVSTLNNLGIDAWYQGDHQGARSLYLEALALARQRSAGSAEEARVLNNLGLLSRDAGDLTAAASYLGQAGQIWRRLDPNGEELARNFVNLGMLASDRGDFALSEVYQREALRRLEALAPESVEVAKILTNLGIIARDRSDLDEAYLLFRRALAIRRRLVPGSPDEASSLSNLSWILQKTGRLREAEELTRQALAIRSRSMPESTETALSLAMLGAIASKRGDHRTAASLATQALVLQRRIAPGTVPESDFLGLLGSIDLDLGRWSTAEAWIRQSLAIRRRLALQTYREADSWAMLGKVLWRLGRDAEAATAFASGIDALEAQIGRLGGTAEARSEFKAQFSSLYEDLITLDLERGDAAAAFATLERQRARILLAQIAERDLAFRADVPAELLEKQRALDREFAQTQREIAGTDPRQEAEIQDLFARLWRLRNERSALVNRIVRTSPHYASLRYPRPLDLAAARRALDPGTVWLCYFVGETATFLFVVSPDEELQVFRLPAGRRQIEEEVAVFRGLILRGRDRAAVEEALLVQGRKLFRLLIAPAAPALEGARRVLISPDGPLHTLPFAALVRPGEPGGFLVEWKPIHTVASATLYAELRRGRRSQPGGGGTLVALADPLIRPAAGARAEPGDLPLRRYRAGLPPLPGAREEVRTLAALYGGDAVIYTGAAATATRLEHLPVRPRYLHLACHALLDRRSPLDSGLALATPAGGDAGGAGLLQAWEIFERLRLDADLVTLSACGTGLGREAAGEGLLSLTRAFQYAGARSVLASLWRVSDRSTPALMASFYASLYEGQTKDVALAEAQRKLLRSGELSHPYEWAGFALSGDWR